MTIRRPCPCGNKKTDADPISIAVMFDLHSHRSLVRCGACGRSTDSYRFGYEAIRAWEEGNSRPSEEAWEDFNA